MANTCVKRNNLVNLVRTTLKNQPFDFFSQDLKFTVIQQLWASIQTKKFNPWFGVNGIDENVSHIFNVRYNVNLFNSLDGKLSFIFDNVSYQILGFENKNEENREIFISCKRVGSVSIPDIQLNENIG